MTDGPPDHTGTPAPPTPMRRRARLRTRRALVGLVAVTACAAVGAHFAVQYVRASRAHARAHEALDRRAFSEAATHTEKYREHRPTSAEGYLLLVRIARRSGDEAAAQAHLAEYERQHPNDPARDRERRFLLAQRGDASEVNALVNEALAKEEAADPLAVEAAIIGGIRLLQADFAVARSRPRGIGAELLARLQRGTNLWLNTRPHMADQVEGLVWRGQLRALANDLAGIDDFRHALALDPNHKTARLQLASAIINIAPQEALAHLEHARRHGPTDPALALALARAYQGLGRPDEARPLLNEVLAAQPNNTEAITELATVAVDTGQYAEAERLLVRAIALAPDQPRPLFVLASCLRAAGRPTEARGYQERFERLVERLHTPATPRPR